MRRTLEISAIIAATILIAMAFYAWLASHDERLRMQATIATQKQQIDAADARERARATALDQTLAQIQKLKRDTQTPEEILKQLPQYLKLPQPITLNAPLSNDDPQPAAALPAEQEKKQKGTGVRLFGRRWFARKATTAGVGERSSPTAENSPASPNANSNSDAVSNQSARQGPGQASPTLRNSMAGPNANLNVDSVSNQGASHVAGRNRSETPSQSASLSAAAQPFASGGGDSSSPSDASPTSDAAIELPDAANRSRPTSRDRAPTSPDRASTTNPNDAAFSSAEIPAADLKPLYDYVQDCRSCQAQLAAAQQNRVDDASKLAAMTRERDAAVTAAKGGTFWRRFRRNLAWFGIGAVTGAASSAAATSLAHCHSNLCRG